jgi:hypothetical protein
LGNLYDDSPQLRQSLKASEFEALSSLAFITSFIKDLSSIITLPTISESRRGFTFRFDRLQKDLDALAETIDMTDILWPIEQLNDPTAAATCYEAFRVMVSDRMGKSMSEMYGDLVQQCISGIQEKHKELENQTSGPSTGGV